jgi:hypothetical protein
MLYSWLSAGTRINVEMSGLQRGGAPIDVKKECGLAYRRIRPRNDTVFYGLHAFNGSRFGGRRKGHITVGLQKTRVLEPGEGLAAIQFNREKGDEKYGYEDEG